jgi:hypothetical protein
MTKPTSGAFDDYPPGQANKFTVTLAVEMVNDQNSNGTPNHGDTIHFAVTNTGDSPIHQISVTGKQNGAVVYGATILHNEAITLGSTAWKGGAADLRAEAFNIAGGKHEVLGSLDFHVDA